MLILLVGFSDVPRFVTRRFLLQDDVAEGKLGCRFATAYQRARQAPLLAGRSVFITPGLLKAEKDGGAALQLLTTQARAARPMSGTVMPLRCVCGL